jgi:hypothetical protein
MPGFLNEQYDDLEVTPIPTFIDPVSKIRVSQPENLIDTDFEYGLQETRWETLERVNNIPTFYARPGDDPLEVSQVLATAGSSRVTVETLKDHKLVVGSPIIVQGVESFSAEGAYVVDDIIDEKTFSYQSKDIQSFPGAGEGTVFNIEREDTVVFIGRLYQGTQSKLDTLESIVTDGRDPSTLTIRTPTSHGFNVGTKFILSNSVGGKTYKFDASQVDPRNLISVETDRKRRRDTYEIVPGAAPEGVQLNYVDWLPKYRSTFSILDVNDVANTISIMNHSFNNGDAVMYFPPATTIDANGSTSNITGVAPSPLVPYDAVYYVVVVDRNTIQLTSTELFPQSQTPAIISLTGFGDDTNDVHTIAKVYRVESVATNNIVTFRRSLFDLDGSDGIASGQECFVFSTSSGIVSTPPTRSFRNFTFQDQLPASYTRLWYRQDNSLTSPGYSILKVQGNEITVATNIVTLTEPASRDPLSSDPSSKLDNPNFNQDFETGDEVLVYRRYGAIPLVLSMEQGIGLEKLPLLLFLFTQVGQTQSAGLEL